MYNNRQIMVLQILIFIFLASQGKTENSGTNGSRIPWGQSARNFSMKGIVTCYAFTQMKIKSTIIN
jgi:hypothetical protein